MTESTPRNDNRVEDCEQGRALLLKHVLDGLRAGNAKASFLAVAHRVLADEAARLAAERRMTATPDTTGLPFEEPQGASNGAPSVAPNATDAKLAEMVAALPFAAPEPDDGAA